MRNKIFFKTKKLQYEVRKIERFDLSADALWEKCQPLISLGIIRDSTYLNWRYCACPVVEYLPIGVFDKKSNNLLGWGIFRANYPAQKKGLLVDWLFDPNEKAAIRLLFRNIENSARISGAEHLETWIPPNFSTFASIFESIGFQRQKTAYNLVALPFQMDITLDWMQENWFYTMGDSDLY